VRYSFGPFELDAAAQRLSRDGEPVAMSDRQIAILTALVSRAGTILSKDDLIEAAWRGVAVTDNSLEQAISNLRRTLGVSVDGASYIETLPRRGYRFSAAVSRSTPRSTPEALDALLAPHRAFLDGRAALETLDADAVMQAAALFEQIALTDPDYAPAHLGLANAMALRFEATRALAVPDGEALTRAMRHADEACRLAPTSGEAWAALGLVCHQSRDSRRAVAAVQRAVGLEPDNWRHHLRLAYVGWGEERLRAARRALQLVPGLALAHWLAATVHVARQAFDLAEQELVTGADAQDSQGDRGRFSAVGLHLLLGLCRLRAGETAAAAAELHREISHPSTQIYAREARANAWCGIASLRLREGDRAGAREAFSEALAVVPSHWPAVAGGAAVADADDLRAREHVLHDRLAMLRTAGASLEAAIVEAMWEAGCGHHESAATVVEAALAQSSSVRPAWSIPIDPLLNVDARPTPWQRALALLRAGAA
jgi:DNA-binding winged helix-turn-helix (wHTH) protein/Tfp pilus assembly protein PilF